MTRVLIAGGGTAGHLVPGLAVAAALVEAGVPADEIHFVGSDRGVEAKMVPAAGFGLDEVPSRGLERKIGLGSIKAGLGLLGAARRGISIVGSRKPGVVVSLGGHGALPGVVGAVVRRRPLVLLEQNVRAGGVNRLLARFATASAVSFPGTDLPRAQVTGNPLRADLVAAAEARRGPDGAAARDDARRALGLPLDRTVVLVTTGSLGSHRVNTAVLALAERWAGRDDVAIRHVTGNRDHEEIAAAAPPPGTLRYDIVPYEDRMPLAMAAADVAVTRAGASTCTELAAFGVPAIMVPLPIATRDHQTANATVLADAGGAVVVPDGELDVDRLEAELAPLVADAARRAEMATAMAGEARLDAAARAAQLILEVAR
ncbi:MAG TPA: UDP-N-acetylglucosamine--N-acetylmuramyl-(pentapeptide) pyrophosphoryl-undecaprenol N-acetylglucosamine transferase [Iamia sp.]|nr:UDP-N-acetylglucosamine--N-acetylmuramyl-(pentapeptide) pyrophosphoryl-undecaprenol N-acetylglucosamine transferase [Iamia sp.]